MLRLIGMKMNHYSEYSPVVDAPTFMQNAIDEKNRYKRNEREDMKKAFEYLYEFKDKLDELHPRCIEVIENILSHKPNTY